jgi:hypothetical protein
VATSAWNTGRTANGFITIGGAVGDGRVAERDGGAPESLSTKGITTVPSVVPTMARMPSDPSTTIVIRRRDHRPDAAGMTTSGRRNPPA